MPDLLILVLVITLDAICKLSSTKKKLDATTMDIVSELKIAGYQNIISAFCVGSAGYSLVKFNVLNFSITNDITERRATICVGVLCGVLWLSGLPLTNIFPRFYLGGLLLFTGLNLLDMVITEYHRVSKKEFTIIIIILVVNAAAAIYVSSNIIIAVTVGLVLSAVIFVWEYSRVSVIRGERDGKDDNSTVIRSYDHQRLVCRLGRRCAILELQGFIFFGTATQVLD
jgi:SulP family sulfate permease